MIKWIEIFNTLTAPIGFFLTIFTLQAAFATRKKLEEVQEVSLLQQESDYYRGKMEAIRMLIENIDTKDRQTPIPENIFIELHKLMSQFKSNFPSLSQNNKLISEPLNKFNELRDEREIKYVDFVEVFYDLESIFLNRKDLK
ncbi:hypothetical protein [Streptococcus caballi]|uniref:hypothetical protein n=1 Tax=Streptococcus caballi TaxID=439220 RepID=UPI000369FD7B|nr:hypothetical protein [Streptococcus caballi]